MTLWDMIRFMFSGIGITFRLVPICIFATFLVGMLLGIVLFRKIPVLQLLLNIYNIVMRGIPALVVLKLLYYSADFSSAFLAAAVSLTLYHSAYIGEIIRGCFEAVPAGQMMAGKSLGLGYGKIMFRIYIPQIFKQMIPAVCGQYILLVKDTTLVYAVGVQDLMWKGRQIMAQTFNPILGYMLIGAFYYILCACIELIAHHAEKRVVSKKHTRSLRAYY